MNELLFPNQDQLSNLSVYGHSILRAHGELICRTPKPENVFNFSAVDGIPVWTRNEVESLRLSVAPSVLQRLAPDQAEVLGISIDDGPAEMDFTFEPLHFLDRPPTANHTFPLEGPEGGKLVVSRSFVDAQDCATIHEVRYNPGSQLYEASIQVIDDELPSDFEEDFNMRVYDAAQHMLSLLPGLMRLEF